MKICPTCQTTYPDDFSLCPRDGARLAAHATATDAQLAAGLSRRFRLIRRLGAGGMGTVFLAEQIGVGNRPVALKVLNRQLLDDPDFLLRFQNEAGSTGRIHHPNVVTIHEAAQADDGTPYIAMEFLEGESLREVLQRRGALPVAEVAEILQQAARGLNAAHKLGIIHRDIKPDNIFLTHDDESNLVVKVVDFGIAKLRESPLHTTTKIVLGTPPYMSSEQAYGMRSDELDSRSDIYSLGVVVYEMLTGRLPFHSDTPAGYLRKHMMEDPPPFRAIAPGLGVPPAVESTVMKALVKDREQRYASALDFAGELSRAAQPSPRAEAPVMLPSTRMVRPPQPEVGQPPPSAKIIRPFEPPPPDSTGATRVNPKEGLKYVWIPPGSFWMGCSPGDAECRDDEKPLHQVIITKGFWLGQTSVTVGAYKRFTAAMGKAMPPAPNFNPGWSDEQMPMVNVSWNDARAYCAWAGGRLPTEAEWEYAARGGSREPRYGVLDEVAWYYKNSGRQPNPVGEKKANGFGLYDMLGNAWEWVIDRYDEKYYENNPSQDPAGPAIGECRVLRGGSWDGEPRFIRVSSRFGVLPGDRGYGIGFRCARDVFPP
jgi:serine/threonine-protein kinase